MWQQDIKKSEWVKAFITGTCIGISISYLFYNNLISLILSIPVTYIYILKWQEEKCRKIQNEFKRHFQVAVTIQTNAISVGYSVENAIREVIKELSSLYGDDNICIKEYLRIQHHLSMNMTIEQALKDMALRVKDEDVQNFVTVFSAAKRSGGDVIQIMNETVRQMDDRLSTKEEIDTVIASGKLEFKIMCTVPFVILLYMRVAFPEFMKILYGNIAGNLFMTVCLLIYGAAYLMGKKITTIEV